MFSWPPLAQKARIYVRQLNTARIRVHLSAQCSTVFEFANLVRCQLKSVRIIAKADGFYANCSKIKPQYAVFLKKKHMHEVGKDYFELIPKRNL